MQGCLRLKAIYGEGRAKSLPFFYGCFETRSTSGAKAFRSPLSGFERQGEGDATLPFDPLRAPIVSVASRAFVYGSQGAQTRATPSDSTRLFTLTSAHSATNGGGWGFAPVFGPKSESKADQNKRRFARYLRQL